MSEPTLYDKIVSGELPARKIWEDDKYLAFLTPFPNTPGFSVVTAKQNPGDNYLTVDEAAYVGLLVAARKVAGLLQKAFGVKRVGLIMEGEGVPHLHVKLIPMHRQADTAGAHVSHVEFYEVYPGYLTTIEGPRMSDEALAEVQQRIQSAQ